jgi:S-adenosylmethionine:tRNA ribosyltransferase-isomerase
MKLSEFNYHLPPGMVAQYPSQKRADSRMLVLNRSDESITDAHFYDLPDFLNSSYFLVLNDSKVFKARLYAKRATGGKAEIFLVRRVNNDKWLCLLWPSGRIKTGEKLYFDGKNFATVHDKPGPIERTISFTSSKQEEYIIKQYGQTPLPPYIKREAGKNDLSRYQTVYADRTGSVAAPTAGLHFDKNTFARLTKQQIKYEKITLHVGPGTFKPVVTDNIESHTVDPEYAVVTARTAKAINRYKQQGQMLLAVGTTSVRTTESVSDTAGLVSPYSGLVDLFIYPPYRYKSVDAMLTNFHLPKTSLLMLVAAFCGHELLFKAYNHAIAKKYRFYSYGDCMLIL